MSLSISTSEGSAAIAFPLKDMMAKQKRKTKRSIAVNNDEPLEGPRTSRHLPRIRAHCLDGHRPCPYVTCKHNLYLDVSTAGSILLNFPHLEPHEMGESCVLDVAERMGMTLEEVGAMFDLTRERIRQVQEKAAEKVKKIVIKRFGNNWRSTLVPGPTDDGVLFRSLVAQIDSAKKS